MNYFHCFHVFPLFWAESVPPARRGGHDTGHGSFLIEATEHVKKDFRYANSSHLGGDFNWWKSSLSRVLPPVAWRRHPPSRRGGAVGVALFEEVGGGIDVGAGAEDFGDGQLAAEAVVGEGDVEGGIGVVDGHELSEDVSGVCGIPQEPDGTRMRRLCVGIMGLHLFQFCHHLMACPLVPQYSLLPILPWNGMPKKRNGNLCC